MNADLMITIAFCVYVLLGSLAVGMLFARSVGEDKAKEAEANRLAAGREPGGAIRQPKVEESWGGVRRSWATAGRKSRRGRRGEKRSHAARSGEHWREVKARTIKARRLDHH